MFEMWVIVSPKVPTLSNYIAASSYDLILPKAYEWLDLALQNQ